MTDEAIEISKLDRHRVTEILCIIIKPLEVRFIVLKVPQYWDWNFVIEFIDAFQGSRIHLRGNSNDGWSKPCGYGYGADHSK